MPLDLLSGLLTCLGRDEVREFAAARATEYDEQADGSLQIIIGRARERGDDAAVRAGDLDDVFAGVGRHRDQAGGKAAGACPTPTPADPEPAAAPMRAPIPQSGGSGTPAWRSTCRSRRRG